MLVHNYTYVDRRTRQVKASPDAVFRVMCRIGGDYGWFSPRWIWKLRGWLDRMVGGPGLRMGRRHPEELHVGDTVDCWRVAAVESSARLELHALMKLPGDGRLQFRFDTEDQPSRTTRLTQTASFKPHGIWGMTYWFVLLPVHKYVFSRMIRGIGRAAEAEARAMSFTAGYSAKEPGLQGPASECEAIDRT